MVSKFLRTEDFILPNKEKNVFQKQGNKKGDKWQCLVELDTGKMWFEVKWKE